MEFWSQRVLAMTLGTDNLAKKLLGMQLTVETIALVIFQRVRELEVEPVLTELMPYYERDEARHVGLGVQLVPQMMNELSIPAAIDVALFQLDLLVDDAHRAQGDRARSAAARRRSAEHARHRLPQAVGHRRGDQEGVPALAGGPAGAPRLRGRLRGALPDRGPRRAAFRWRRA